MNEKSPNENRSPYISLFESLGFIASSVLIITIGIENFDTPFPIGALVITSVGVSLGAAGAVKWDEFHNLRDELNKKKNDN